MRDWEVFETTTQMLLAPLLADTTKRPAFAETNENHERMFFDFVARLMKPSHFIEIGAHEARASNRVAQALPETTCFAFEADRDVYDYFTSKGAIHAGVQYIYSAVSNRTGEVAFYKDVKVEPTAAAPFSGNNSVLRKPGDKEYTAVNVPTTRLDDFFQSGQGAAQTLESAVLWIDAEGHAYDVLQGAPQVLNKTVGIYVEVEDYPIWIEQKTAFDVFSLLDRFGFVPVTRDVETPGQYNVLLLKRPMHLERSYRSRIAMYHAELSAIVANEIREMQS
ncbi:MAG: FkbM family methyltransferase [Pseudomonadota bacterium]